MNKLEKKLKKGLDDIKKGKINVWKCPNCNHLMSEHFIYIGCKHYDIKDKSLIQGYCPCKNKKR